MSLPASPSASAVHEPGHDADETTLQSPADGGEAAEEGDSVLSERMMQPSTARPARTYSRPCSMSDASLTSTQIGSPIFSSTPMRPKSPTFTSTVAAVRPKSPVAVVTSTVVDSGVGASAVTTTAAAAGPNDGGKETEPDPTEPLDGTIFSEISETPEPEPLEPLPTTRIVPRKKRKTMSQKAGLTLNVRRVYKYLKAGKYAKRITMMGAVYLTSVLEYMTAEILELAGNAAEDNKKKRISPRHVMLAVMFDQELYAIFNEGKVIMPGTGVAPFIHKELLPKNPNSGDPVVEKPKTAVKDATTKDVAVASPANPPLNQSQEY